MTQSTNTLPDSNFWQPKRKLTRTVPLQSNCLRKLGTPLTNLDDWYKWAMKIDHQYQKIKRANERTRGNMSTQSKDKNPRQQFFFPRKERDPNAMDVTLLPYITFPFPLLPNPLPTRTHGYTRCLTPYLFHYLSLTHFLRYRTF